MKENENISLDLTDVGSNYEAQRSTRIITNNNNRE